MARSTFLIASAVCAAACSGGASTTENRVTVEDVSNDSFRIRTLGTAACKSSTESGDDKLLPSRSELIEQVGKDTVSFLVGMRDDSYMQYSFGDEARAQSIADSQACAVRDLNEHGGEYIHSFVLINAFVAHMTVDTAVRLSKREDVKAVELSETNIPPP